MNSLFDPITFQEIQTQVVIVPEPISNTLLVSATPRYFAEIIRLISEIDQMPPQVVIQTEAAPNSVRPLRNSGNWIICCDEPMK